MGGAASGGESSVVDFELPNGGPGPDPFHLSEADADLAVVLFHRDYLCGTCRKQVASVAERHGEFRDRTATVVSVVPEPKSRCAEWADTHDAPFPVLADEEKAVCDRYDQPVAFGPLGRLHDVIGRMPVAALVDLRRDPEVLWRHAGSTPTDRPDVDRLLELVEMFD